MPRVRLIKIVLGLFSLLAFVLCLIFGWLFYDFYLRWLWLFEDGRYFDPEAGVVHHDSSSV